MKMLLSLTIIVLCLATIAMCLRYLTQLVRGEIKRWRPKFRQYLIGRRMKQEGRIW